MSIKKPNSPSGWKNKLDELDCLPGEMMPDNNSAWQKLNSRLQDKKRSRKALWYWAAAALLPVCMLSFWLISNKKHNTEDTATVHKQTKGNDTAGLLFTDIDTVTAIRIIKDEMKPVVHTRAKIEDAIPGTAAVKEPVTGIDTSDIVIVQQPIIPVQPVDTTAITAAIVPAKKKLKVVHINELNEPGLPARVAFPGEDYSVLQFRLINQQVYTTSSPSGSIINFRIPSSKKNSTN